MPSWSESPLPLPHPAAQAAALASASHALWLATLSLMTAFMNTRAPAHRYLLARRIARNFDTLRQQECFSSECRRRFEKLRLRWSDTASELSPNEERAAPAWGTAFRRLLRNLR